MTPQYSYPLMYSLKNKSDLEMIFVTAIEIPDNEYYLSNYPVTQLPMPFIFGKSNNILNKLFKPISILINYLYLLKIIRKSKNTILHFNWFSLPVLEYLFISLFKFQGCKIILNQHNYIQHHLNKLRYGEKKIFKLANKIICLSAYVKHQFPKLLQEKIRVIPHRNCYEELIEDKGSNNLGGKQIYRLLCAGNLKSYKGIELSIETIEYLIEIKNVDNIFLDIVGFGTEKMKIEIQNAIDIRNLNEFINFEYRQLNFTELNIAIKQCSIGRLPYTKASQSGLPYIFATHYKPMIITNVGGLNEQSDESFCAISEPSVESLSENILNLIDKLKNDSINNSHFINYLRKSSWDKSIDEFYGVYTSICL